MEALPLWQCAGAVEGAIEAAAAARGVPVGGGDWAAAVQQLLTSPAWLALAAAVGMSFADIELPAMVRVVKNWGEQGRQAQRLGLGSSVCMCGCLCIDLSVHWPGAGVCVCVVLCCWRRMSI